MLTQFFHEFKGFGVHPSTCLVKVIEENEKYLICFVDLGEGTSVTNASEQLATEIIKHLECNHEDCRFFETYSQYDFDSFDEIEYDWIYVSKNLQYEYDWFEAKYPKWKPGAEEIKEKFDFNNK